MLCVFILVGIFCLKDRPTVPVGNLQVSSGCNKSSESADLFIINDECSLPYFLLGCFLEGHSFNTGSRFFKGKFQISIELLYKCQIQKK